LFDASAAGQFAARPRAGAQGDGIRLGFREQQGDGAAVVIGRLREQQQQQQQRAQQQGARRAGFGRLRGRDRPEIECARDCSAAL